MKMMRKNGTTNENVMVIGIDHGYGNIKTANTCFQTGVTRYEKEPTFWSMMGFTIKLERNTKSFWQRR